MQTFRGVVLPVLRLLVWAVIAAASSLCPVLWPHLPAAWRLTTAPGVRVFDKPSFVGCAPRKSRPQPASANDLLRRIGAAEGDPDAAWAQGWQVLGDAIGGHGRAHGEHDALASGVVAVATDATTLQRLQRAVEAGEVRSTWLAGVLGWPVQGAAADIALRAGLEAEGVSVEVRQQRPARATNELQREAALLTVVEL